MRKPKRPWRRGGRLGPGLLDLSKGTLPMPEFAWNCCLCGADRSHTLVGAQALPGVSRNREPAICVSCLHDRGEGPYCAGCDKRLVPFVDDTSSRGGGNTAWAAELEIGGKYLVYVCGDAGDYSTTPLLQCRRKARLALALCPGGCGSWGVEPGDLCERCASRLSEVRRLTATEAEQTLRRTSVRVPSELAELVANAVTGRGADAPKVQEARDDQVEIHVNVLASQATALMALADAFVVFGKRKKDEGFAEGNAFLTRLARGSLSMDDLNRRTT